MIRIALGNLIWVCLCCFSTLHAQNVLVSPGSGNYPTLRDAFNAIGSGSHTGNVVITITGNTTETMSAALFLPVSVTSVLIKPSGNRTISGNIAGAPLIDLNGSDNVTIDGLNTNGHSLTIANTSTASTANTSTLMIRNDAVNVTVRNCTILGSSQVTSFTIGGTIFIGNTLFSQSATGNDNLVIENNNIGPAGTNFPAKAVHCNGFASNLPNFQERIRFSGNKIYDFFSAAGSSHGMLVQSSRSVWAIRDNHFFQTTAKTHTSNTATQTVLEASAGTGTSTGVCLIENNTIGYATAAKTGKYEILSPGLPCRWYGIRIDGAGAIARNNTITALTFNGAGSGSGSTNPLSIIYAGSGARIVGNTIGNPQQPADILYNSTAAAASSVFGIWANGVLPGSMIVDSNVIAGIKITAGVATTSMTLSAMDITGPGADTIYIRQNTIGSPMAPLENTATGSSSRLLGIVSAQANCKIENNVVHYLLTETGNIGSTTGNLITGIEVRGGAGTIAQPSMNMVGNTIHHLQSNHPNSSGWIKAIDFQGPAAGNHSIQRNFIHNLLIPNSTNPNATIAGVHTNHTVSGSVKGNTVVVNNMIALGISPNSSLVRIYGAFEVTEGNNMQYYFNTIYIGGSVPSGNQTNSYGLRSFTSRTFLNNIIVNNRVNITGTNKHYALSLGGSIPNVALLSNRNILLSNSVLVLYGIFEYTNLASWQAASGQDANSISADPLLAAPTAATPDLHLSTLQTSPAENMGTPVTGITIDFDGEARSATPDIGADEKSTPLPVAWGRMEVIAKGTQHEIQWTTYTETNNLGFDIEASTDGMRFTPLAFVPSQAVGGNSHVPLHYRFSHTKPASGRNWYRIKQIDKDGKFSYSRILMAELLATEAFSIKVWPNPAKGKLQVVINGMPMGQQAELRLVTLQGKTVWSGTLSSNNLIIPVQQLPNGIYTLVVSLQGDIITSQKVLIQ